MGVTGWRIYIGNCGDEMKQCLEWYTKGTVDTSLEIRTLG